MALLSPDFQARRTANAAKTVCLNDLPWEGWPYSPPPSTGPIIEGDIEQLLRLSRSNTVKPGQALASMGASSSSAPPRLQHYTVETSLYRAIPLENAYVICAQHVGKEVESNGYGAVQVSQAFLTTL